MAGDAPGFQREAQSYSEEMYSSCQDRGSSYPESKVIHGRTYGVKGAKSIAILWNEILKEKQEPSNRQGGVYIS
jgi:hypothetical protein